MASPRPTPAETPRRRRRRRGPTGPTGPVALGMATGGDHLSAALVRLPAGPGTPAHAWRLLGQLTLHRGHRHADAVLGVVDQLLAAHGLGPKDLGLIAAERGPGGFTGVRVGLATALGLALGVGAPVWPVPSLQALALHARASGGLALPLIDARKGQVYGAVYEADTGRQRLAPEVSAHTALLERAASLAQGVPVHVFGSGALAYGCQTEAPPAWHVLTGWDVATVAARAWEGAGRPKKGPAIDPAYVRPSDAELSQGG